MASTRSEGGGGGGQAKRKGGGIDLGKFAGEVSSNYAKGVAVAGRAIGDAVRNRPTLPTQHLGPPLSPKRSPINPKPRAPIGPFTFGRAPKGPSASSAMSLGKPKKARKASVNRAVKTPIGKIKTRGNSAVARAMAPGQIKKRARVIAGKVKVKSPGFKMDGRAANVKKATKPNARPTPVKGKARAVRSTAAVRRVKAGATKQRSLVKKAPARRSVGSASAPRYNT